MILQNAEGVKKQIYFDNPKVEENNAILEELESFARSIKENKPTAVTYQEATNALKVAKSIIENF
jgi:hypothetical protein